MKLKHVADMLSGPISYLGRFAKRAHLVAGHNTGPRYMDNDVTPQKAAAYPTIKSSPAVDKPVDEAIQHRGPKRRKIET